MRENGTANKIYWSDREGNPPPDNCTFWKSTFVGTPEKIHNPEFVKLPPPTSVKVLRKTFSPDKKTWIQNVEKALRQKDVQKVVLARTCILELATAPDPFAIAAALQQKAKGAFVFCFNNFLGATPERLFVRKQRNIVSEALAGTLRGGITPKELREFTPVQEHVKAVLTPLCDHLSFSPISIHHTHNLQHLYSSCSGTLKNQISDEQILSQLHPTPALCGVPKNKALALIRELEPFERGLYCGALGWTTPDASEWIVGIRSCLLEGNKATLYSGTGIVSGSDPEAEWDELDRKLELFDTVLYSFGSVTNRP